jgi:PKD repeat protein
LQPDREKSHPFALKADYKDPSNTRIPHQRLKAGPVTTSYSEKLDSIYYFIPDTVSGAGFLSGADYYLFDVNGRNYSYWSASYNQQLLAMVPNSKTSLTYSGDNLASETYSSWSVASGRWEPYYRNIYSYDPNGNQVTLVSQGWDTYLLEWYYNYLDSLTYDGNGKLVQRTTYYYDTELYIWNPSNRTFYEYEGDNLVRVSDAYNYAGGPAPIWQDNSEVIYTYDAFNRPVLELQRYWDSYDLQWTNSDSTIYVYDGNGNLTVQEVYGWNGEIYIWDPNWKEEYSYDANNRQTQAVYYSSDWFSSTWYIVDKYEYLLDANGNLLEETYFMYDTASALYTPNWKDVYEYDLSMDVGKIAMPYWYGMDFDGEDREGESSVMFVNKVTGYKEMSWNPNLTAFEIIELDSIYYSGLYDSPVNDAGCKADFTWQLDINDDKLVHFYETSDSAVISWYWMFGDGQTSTRKNPNHLYAKPGTYKVILTTVDESGFCSNTVVKQIVVGNPSCHASFTYLLDTLKMQVSMINQSEGSGLRYYWSFGDGSVDKNDNPVHVYNYPGSYLITLTVSSGTGDCIDRYATIIRSAGNFCNPDFAVFVDSSSNTGYFRAKNVIEGNKYYWMVGDGSTGNNPNYVHTFKNPGYYSAVLTVFNEKAGCLESRKETFLVGRKSQDAIADFSYLANDDNSVQFTNQSIGQELKFFWNFNDGETSEETDPLHPFVLPGYYTVCLTAINPSDGSRDMHCEKIFAGTSTLDQCQARFEYMLSNNGLRIDCWDRSFGDPNRWLWNYNKDWTTEEKDPTWDADEPSYVMVHQKIWNESGCRDDAYALVNMGAEDRFKAGFAYSVDSIGKKADTYPVDFIGESLGDLGKLKWSFGDGTYDSTTVNPTHQYAQPGVYHVCLTVTNTSTGESDMDCQNVTVGWAVFLDELHGLEVGLKTYPNPFRESARIEIVLGEETPFDLSVFDLMGRKVMTIAEDSRPAGSYSFDIDGARLEGGSYYLILETDIGRAEQLINLIK